MQMKFQITNDSVMVMYEGKPVTIRKGATNFQSLVNVLLAGKFEEVPNHLTAHKSIGDWLSGLTDFAASADGKITYKDEALPEAFTKKIHEMVTKSESPTSLFNFWVRLQRNPSARSVEQLWSFLGHCNIPLTEDGHFLAYKKVREDLKDFYTGTVTNAVGTVLEMPRNKISDDPREACHFGYHVGSLKYADQDYKPGRGRLLIVKVDPENVVSVPYDYSAQKMRVCKYVVEGLYVLPLSNTLHEEFEDDSDDSDEIDESFLEHGDSDPRDCESCNLEEEKSQAVVVKIPARFKKIHVMDMAQLFEQSIADLRTYATHGLKLVGASKIPGGKTALIQSILANR
jgi:hypothetical protein